MTNTSLFRQDTRVQSMFPRTPHWYLSVSQTLPHPQKRLCASKKSASSSKVAKVRNLAIGVWVLAHLLAMWCELGTPPLCCPTLVRKINNEVFDIWHPKWSTCASLKLHLAYFPLQSPKHGNKYTRCRQMYSKERRYLWHGPQRCTYCKVQYVQFCSVTFQSFKLAYIG